MKELWLGPRFAPTCRAAVWSVEVIRGVVAIIFLFCLPLEVVARENRVNQLPHGNRFSCDICHTPTRGLTDFGFDSFDFTENGNVIWERLAERDSDRDGYTNGMELGDPNGTWRPGQANPSGEYTDPNDPNDNFCGDGTFQSNEECEGSDLRGSTCASLGLVRGSLSCTGQCVFDTSLCGDCGDGVKQDNEECDGTDLGDATCEAIGFEGGALVCNASCRLITSQCVGDNHGSVPATCGNRVRDVGENCDGSDVGGATCQSLGYNGGFLGCSAQCTFDASTCFQGDSSPDAVEGPTETPFSQGSPLAPAAASGGTIQMDGRACSTGGIGASWMLLCAFVFFRRRKTLNP